MWKGGTNVQDKGRRAISLNCVMWWRKLRNLANLRFIYTQDVVDKNYLTHTHTHFPLHSHTRTLYSPCSHTLSPCCKRNVNVFQTLRYISAISGTVLSTTMVCREQPSRDQCSLSWISEGDILCKFISHCEQASQLVNGAVCTTALFTHSLQSASSFPPHPLHRLALFLGSRHSSRWHAGADFLCTHMRK